MYSATTFLFFIVKIIYSGTFIFKVLFFAICDNITIVWYLFISILCTWGTISLLGVFAELCANCGLPRPYVVGSFASSLFAGYTF